MSSLANLFRRSDATRQTSSPRSRRRGGPARRGLHSQLRIERLEDRRVMNADPVLMVIADGHDFYYQEYNDTRIGLEAQGLDVVVAATTTAPSTPHAGSGQGGDSGVVTPDIALADVDPDDYSAIVFVGGWGSSMYQYDFPGDYLNDRYDGDLATKEVVNRLINEFVAEDKHVAAICHGVTVLAWARVDGVSPLDGRQVSVPFIGSPAVVYQGEYFGYFALGQHEQVVSNGAIANTASGQYGDPTTVADDVVVDGKIITAENYDAALAFGRRVGQEVLAAAEKAGDSEQPVADPEPVPVAQQPLPVLMVISNQDFWYQDYADARASLEAAGVSVVVAAATLDEAIPHANSGQGRDGGRVRPNVTLTDASAVNYSAIVFVGGWGMSQYQYANETTYDNASYNGSRTVRAAVNDLINDFVDQDKYITAVCYGVSVLAWARVDGQSLLADRTVVGWEGVSPHVDSAMGSTRDQIEANGATMLAACTVGDASTSADDVVVDGRIITGQDYQSAAMFGHIVAKRVTDKEYREHVDSILAQWQ